MKPNFLGLSAASIFAFFGIAFTTFFGAGLLSKALTAEPHTYEVRVYSAKWCGACKEQQKLFDQNGWNGSIGLNFDGERVEALISKVEISDDDTRSIPFTEFWIDGELRGAHEGRFVTAEDVIRFAEDAYLGKTATPGGGETCDPSKPGQCTYPNPRPNDPLTQ